MKVLFPDGLDFSLSPSRANKNLVEQSNRFTQDDVLYILDELEKKVGVGSSTDTASHDYKIRTLETTVSGLSLGNISSISNSDGTLTISPTTGAVVASLNLAHANTLNAQQVFKGGADGTPALIAQQWSVTDTANIFQCKQSTGAVIAWVTSAGDVHGEDFYGDLYLFNGATGRVGSAATPASLIHLTNGSSIQGLAGGDPDDVSYTILYFDTVSGAKTINIPAANGTMAVSASGNIALNSTTGNITFTGTLAVANGGTGATTFTSNGVLYGNGTGAVQATAAGTSGYLLYSNAGVPAWTNTPSVSTLTITGGTVTLSADTNFVLSGGVNGISFDTDVLSIDATNNRVGIGTASPSFPLHIYTTALAGDVRIEASKYPKVSWKVDSGAADTKAWQMYANYDASSLNWGALNDAESAETIGLQIVRSGYTISYVSVPNSNLGIGTTSFGTSAVKVLSIGNGTAPSTSPADLNQIYSVDLAAGNSALHIRTESGSLYRFGTWLCMPEVASNPTTSILTTLTDYAVYRKADKFVVAYNNGGTMYYLTIPLDGSTTTWTNGTTAP
jgi:hypothetical protein